MIFLHFYEMRSSLGLRLHACNLIKNFHAFQAPHSCRSEFYRCGKETIVSEFIYRNNLLPHGKNN